MKRFIHEVNQIMTQLSGISLCFIIVFILVDIIGRTFSRTVFGASEFAIFAMIIAVYLGFSYCEEKKSHIRIEVFLSYLPPKYKKILNLVDYFLVFVMLGIVVYSVGIFALSSYKNKCAVAAGTKPLVIYPVIFVMLISCIFYWIQVGLNFVEKFNDLFKKDLRKLN
ncbi:hypothetical protein ES708_07522 [subsurface metagenome]